MRIYKQIIIFSLVVLLGGCQATPQVNNIFYKGDDSLEEAIQKTAPPIENNNENISWSVQETYDHNITLEINAEFNVPKTDKLPVINIEPRYFEGGQELKQIVEAIYPEAEIYNNPHELYKEQIEEDIVYYKGVLYELENAEPLDDPRKEETRLLNLEESKKWLEGVIKDLETQYEKAPEKRPVEMPTYQFEKVEDGSMQYSCIADLKDEKQEAEFDFVNSEEWVIFLLKTEEDIVDDFNEIVDITDESIQALKESMDTLVENMGIDYMDLNVISKAGEDEYCFYYMRSYNGIMETYVKNYFGTTAITDGDIYMDLWQPEYLCIKTYQNEIVGMTWESPSQIKSVENENVATLPWEEIKEIFLKQFKRVFLNQDFKDTIISIKRVELGFTKILVKDTKNYRLIPTWSFFATITNSTTEEPVVDGQNCIFTINAIDGSIIDRGVMY